MPARPVEVTVGVRVIAVVWCLNLIGTVFSAYAQFRELPPGDIASISLMVTLGVAAILFGFLLRTAWAAGKGRNWARIVLAAVVALGALLVLYGTISGLSEAPVENAISLLAVTLQAGAVVLLYRPKSNRWYSAMKDAGA